MKRRAIMLMLAVFVTASPTAGHRWPTEGNTTKERVTFGGWNQGFAGYAANRCLVADTGVSIGYSYLGYVKPAGLGLFPCTTNLNINETTWLFPNTAKNIRIKSSVCWLKGTGMTNGETIALAPRWRDYTGTDHTAGGATSVNTLTVAGSGAFTAASGGPGVNVCPYTTCGLYVRVNSNGLTAGTDVIVQCSVMVEYSYGS